MGKSRKLHRGTNDRFPVLNTPVYKDEDVECVQSLRTLKFWIRYNVANRVLVYWSESFDFDMLSEVKKLRNNQVVMVKALALHFPPDIAKKIRI